MSTKLKAAVPDLEDKLETLAKKIFNDKRLRSLGIGGTVENPCFVAVRNSAIILPQAAANEFSPTSFAELPVLYEDTPGEIDSYLRIPLVRPMASNVIEQQNNRPLCVGLEIQNFDSDSRSGILDQGLMTVGTLGCFVQNGPKFAMLSNNHVLAGENSGHVDSDRILQPATGHFANSLHAATLTRFVELIASPANASIASGNAVLNSVDAAIAELMPGVEFEQRYHEKREGLPKIKAFGDPQLGQKVLKVGRTTGLTHGEIKQVTTLVGPVSYSPGLCWFRRSFVIEGINGSKFSDHGDSGSAIVTYDGTVLGLLYAGNGKQTYACPISEVLSSLNVSLA
ncbi:MAG: hypothetical protein C0473_01225 [Cyanobacteria bacterium DS3.002]|nr:hypothetical protein [Cyanobacteria bacterium DS3.002]